jgi:hypothetical protein
MSQIFYSLKIQKHVFVCCHEKQSYKLNSIKWHNLKITIKLRSRETMYSKKLNGEDRTGRGGEHL